MDDTTLRPVSRAHGNPVLQAYQILAGALQAGAFPAHSKLPSERALAERLGVSRATVRQVLTALSDSDLVHASANRGWFAAPRSLEEGPNALQTFTELARQRGLTPTSRILRQEVRPATLDEAESLAIAPTAPVIELSRVHGLDGIDVGVDHGVLPASRFPGFEHIDMTNQSLFEVLESRFGVVPTRCDYEVQAQAADAEVAGLLAVEPGSPVLVGMELVYDQDGKPIRRARTSYRGEAYRFKASLFRT